MKIRRPLHELIDGNVTDAHIALAIADPNRVVETSQATRDGTLYRIYGYTRAIPGGRNVTYEDLYGRIDLALLVIVYLDERDRGQVANVAYAMEASEEEFWQYG